MFNNIGEKIKMIAQVVCGIGIAISVIYGLIIMVQDEGAIFIGLLIMVLGSFASWIGSLFTYGFGQLIENSDTLVKISKRTSMALKSPSLPDNKPAESQKVSESDTQDTSIRCPHCDKKIEIPEGTLNAICPWCNTKLLF